uniref:Water stress and hypersensitive response domain-containing protein n=1 Tax=Populus davidiana TaxID=266767 RepID=A0A6M2EUK5_9ROSI
MSPKFMGKKVKWSWTTALVGAASATAAVALISAKPKDPTFHLIKINFTSFKLRFPVIDTDVILTVHVTNPNIIPIHYSSTILSIFYDGSLIGSAQVEAGSQRSRSCQILELTARLDGVELMANHSVKFFSDVAKREMVLDAKVDIGGTARLLWWGHRFNVHVDSHITVDPLFLDIIDQENKSRLDVFLA